jgi:hypothetical protein
VEHLVHDSHAGMLAGAETHRFVAVHDYHAKVEELGRYRSSGVSECSTSTSSPASARYALLIAEAEQMSSRWRFRGPLELADPSGLD